MSTSACLCLHVSMYISLYVCWATVYKAVCPVLSDRCPVCLSVCLSVLSVTLVHCGQTVGRIKMKLGMQVGLGPGHIVLDGDPAPLPSKGHSPHFSAKRGQSPSPIFQPLLLWANGWMHQDGTWYGGRPQPRRLCVRWGPSCPQKKGHIYSHPIFWPMSVVAN